ncbi:MAG: hypothetical protein ACFN26_09165 [Kingella denitrificans]
MGCRLLWWAQAMLSGSLKQGVQAALENRIGIAANLCRFPLAARAGKP